MLSAVLAVTLSCFGVGAVLIALAGRRASAAVRRQRWLKLATYFAIVHVVLWGAWLGPPYPAAGAAAVLAAGAWELAGAVRRGAAWPASERMLAWAAYAALALGCLCSVWRLPSMTVAFLYLVVACFDGFSQAVGQLAGRRSLAPRVSPAKTVEGALGGALAAPVVAVLLRPLADLSGTAAAVLGGAICLAALAGDLAASWVKRRAGIKDFSALIPGHGGVLDRFDSFIGAGALVGPALVWMQEHA